MNEAMLYFVVFLAGMAVGGALVAFAPREREAVWVAKERTCTDEQEAVSKWMPTAAQMMGDLPEIKPMPAFNVTGKPRRAPWNQRRKELEAAARTKRKQLEEYRNA